jgi:threonine dehydrogenase-like Zn-dependent dehydrogenase
MKALVLSKYKQLDLVDMAKPQPGEDDLLIRVQACGICGSDVHGYDGSTGRRLPPFVLGSICHATWHWSSERVAVLGSTSLFLHFITTNAGES